jgi:hypothetical protein
MLLVACALAYTVVLIEMTRGNNSEDICRNAYVLTNLFMSVLAASIAVLLFTGVRKLTKEVERRV